MNLAGFHIIWLTAWCTFVSAVFYFLEWHWMTIPWVPVALIGTAVAFFVGFKNNQAYDRLWEARKIWGAIVNVSRSFTSMLYGFDTENADAGITKIQKRKLKHKMLKKNYMPQFVIF